MENPVQCECNAHAAQGFRVTKALLAEEWVPEEWVLKKSFKIWKNFRLILFVSWSRI